MGNLHGQRELPEGWEWKRLGDVAEYINGRAFKPTEWVDSGKPIIRIQNLTDESNFFNYFDGECEQDYCIKNGDILISWSASLGVFLWNRGDAVLNQHIFKAIPNEKIIDRGFFVFVIRSVMEDMERKTHGSTMKHIVKSEFNNIEIPLPPLPTQRRIVSILEKAEEIMRLRAQADELMNTLLQSVFLQMFGDPVRNPKGWEIKQIDTVCSKVTDGEHNVPPRTETGIPLLMATNVRDGYVDLSEISYISEEDHQKCIKRCNPEEGDVLLVCVGATIGRVAIVPKMDEFSLVRSVALLKPNYNKITSQYLLWCLKTNSIQSRLLARRNTSAQAGLYLNELKKIKLPIPSLPFQQKFAQVVKRVESVRQNQKQSQQEIDNLLNTLMQKAFKGELAA